MATGQKFVLLPGLDGTGQLFEPILDAMTPEGEATVCSYPNDEELDYKELVELVVDEVTDGDILIAESYSGPIAIDVAVRRQLKALVLCNTFAKSPSWSSWRHLPWATLFHARVPWIVAAQFLVGFDQASTWLAKVREVNERVAPQVRANRIRAALTVDVTDSLASVSCPILVLRGIGDRLVLQRSFDHLIETNPAIRVESIAGPHLLLQVRPQESWDAIRRFLVSLEGL